MTDKEILQKAIERARKTERYDHREEGFADININYIGSWIIYVNEVARIIFSHKFAKAFWGEELINIEEIQTIIENKIETSTKSYRVEKAWRFHIAEMVKCEKPLLYLEKFLEK